MASRPLQVLVSVLNSLFNSLPYWFGAAYVALLGILALTTSWLSVAFLVVLGGYAVLTLATLYVLVVFYYRQGGVGLMSLGVYMRGAGWRHHLFVIGASLLWPLGWWGTANTVEHWIYIAIEPSLYLGAAKRYGGLVEVIPLRDLL